MGTDLAVHQHTFQSSPCFLKSRSVGMPKPPTLAKITRLLVERPCVSIRLHTCPKKVEQKRILSLRLFETASLKTDYESMRNLERRGINLGATNVRENLCCIVWVHPKNLVHD